MPQTYNALEGLSYWCKEEYLEAYKLEVENYKKLLAEEKEYSQLKRNFYSTEYLLSLKDRATPRPPFFSVNIPSELLKEGSKSKRW